MECDCVLNNRIYFIIKWGQRLLYTAFCPAINRLMNYYIPGDFIDFKGFFLDSSRDYDIIRIYDLKF